MDCSELPKLSYERGGSLSLSLAVYDRDNSLIVVPLGKENDYSGEFINIGRVCIALSESMEAVDMQIPYSSGEGKVVSALALPRGAAARVVFPGSYLLVDDDCSIEVHPEMSVIHLFCSSLSSDTLIHLSIAQNVVFDVTSDNRLAGIWISEIQQR